MLFKFNVNLTDDDYFEYNKFVQIRSSYGKKSVRFLKIFTAVLYLVLLIYYVISSWQEKESLIISIPIVLIGFVLTYVFLPKVLSNSIKRQIKRLNKSGTKGYTPKAVLEFYDENFVEITQDSKTEMKYALVEQISIVDNKIIYFHINNLMAYLLPMASFENREQYKEFITFIKTKCNNVVVYSNYQSKEGVKLN